MKTSTVLLMSAIIVATGAFLYFNDFFTPTNPTGSTVLDTSGKYDEFAQCITDAGATFYGASWCSHCNAQKKEFGSSLEFVNSIECALPDGGQTDICKEAGITAYPTWEFADGSRITGELSFEKLSEKTDCELP